MKNATVEVAFFCALSADHARCAYPADTNLGIALRASTACAYSVM